MERYQDDIDFAFFAVHFHYSRADYEAITPLQKALIMKEYERYLVSTTQHIRNAVLNAEYNANRKKGKKFQDLWKKQPKAADMNMVKNNLKTIEEANKNDGNWIEKIMKANGIQKKKKSLNRRNRRKKEEKNG